MLGTQPRDLRRSLFSTFKNIIAIDLNGSVRRDGAADTDEPVFEIMTGVGIGVFSLPPAEKTARSTYVNKEGTLGEKFEWLSQASLLDLGNCDVAPIGPNYHFWQVGGLAGEFGKFLDLPDYFGTGDRHSDMETYWSTGFATQQDEFAIAFRPEEFDSRISLLARSGSREAMSLHFRMCSTNQWNYDRAVRYAQNDEWRADLCSVAYRPFDSRFSIANRSVMTIMKERVQDNLTISNIALLTSRIVNDSSYAHAFAVNSRADKIFLSSKTSTNAYAFPLWLKPNAGEAYRVTNIHRLTAQELGGVIGLSYNDGILRGQQTSMGAEFRRERPEQLSLERAVWDGRGDLTKTFGPQDLFDWIYAILHAPGYRSRYSEFLKSDFPRIPTPGSRELFAALVPLGARLVALHLLKPEDASVLERPEIRFAGQGEARVERGFPQYENGKVMINTTRWFEDVPKATWEFHVGGYQVCEKWLKDRARKGGQNPKPGRVLTDEDILHYRRVVVALTETRRVMTEIERVIDQHGGWPDAFAKPGE